jgi:hypothetical protein
VSVGYVVSRLRSLAFKMYGEPPPKGAPRSESLRWLRGFYLKPLPVLLVICALALVLGASTWMLVLLGIGAAIWVQGFVSLNIRIRRDERREA